MPVVLGLVEAGKRAGLPSRFAPLLSIALGVVAGLITNNDAVQGVVTGIYYGLAASGIYDIGTKTILNNGSTKKK